MLMFCHKNIIINRHVVIREIAPPRPHDDDEVGLDAEGTGDTE
jgi:hypothetical protein